MNDRKNNAIKSLRLYRLFWLLPGLVFFGLYRLAFVFPQFVETVYSRSIFRVTNQALSTVTGVLPFSLGEFMLYAFVLFLVAFIIVMIVKSVLSGRRWWITLIKRFVVLLGVASMLYALFVGLWAFNYARQPLGATLALDTSPATVEELYSTCKVLVSKAVALREIVDEDENGVFMLDRDAAMIDTAKYYNMTANDTGFDFLGGSFGRAKPVLYSNGLSETNITGIYFPFSAEANVNAHSPDLFFAATTLHEAAHQRGFAREDEANFLAYYIGVHSSDAASEYSCVMLALVHAMNKLHGEDEERFSELRAMYSPGMNADLQSNRDYWKEFEGKAADISEQVNNTYLKSNLQADGVKSYGRMVDLLIGLWRSGSL